MKNLTSLIIVFCLLIILGCKCQSDLFDSEKDTATPTPAATSTATPTPTPSASPSRTATPDESRNSGGGGDSSSDENPRLATGTYTGRGTNTTYNKSGDFLLRIDSVDSKGNVKGYLEASNGLEGKATMTGTVTREGKLTMSGTLDNGQSGAVSGTVSGDTISAGYGIAGLNMKTQSGNFTVKRR